MPRRPKGWNVWTEKDGKSYRCRWVGIYGTGQQVFIYKLDAQEYARAKRQDFERMRAGLPPAIRVADAVTVGAYAKTYLSNSQREKGLRTYRNFDLPAITSFVEAHGRLALAALTDQHIRDWKHSAEKRYNGTTASMHFRIVRAFLNSAVKAGHLAKSPARHVSRPVEGPGGRALTDAEITALFSQAPPALLKVGAFALNTLLRINEVLSIEWGWISELEDGSWMGRIPAEVRKTRGKVTTDCTFPINRAAREAMGPRGSGRVFPFAAVTIQHQVIAARKAAELPDDITFHCFRHTGASRYLNAGGHMEDLLKSRLWNDPRSLLRYVHLDIPTLARRFEAIAYPALDRGGTK